MNLNKGISTPIAILLIIAVSAVVGVLVWQFKDIEGPKPEPTEPQATTSEEVILRKINKSLPEECNIEYEEVEKENWYSNSPTSVTLQKNICPEIKNYEEEKIWKAQKKISDNIIAVSLTNINLVASEDYFICYYAQDDRAAPGIKELRDACVTPHVINYSDQPQELASNFLTCYLEKVETPEDFLEGVKGCEQYLQEEYKQELLNREASTDPVFWSGDQLPAKKDIKLETTEKKKSTATVRISFPNLWPNHYVEMSLILIEGNWKIKNIWPLE